MEWQELPFEGGFLCHRFPGPKDSCQNSIKSVAVCHHFPFFFFTTAPFSPAMQLSRAWLCGFFLFDCLVWPGRALSGLAHLHFGPKRVSARHATWLDHRIRTRIRSRIRGLCRTIGAFPKRS